MHNQKHSIETRKQISDKLKILYKKGKIGKGLKIFKKGCIPWSKGKKLVPKIKCEYCGKEIYRKRKEQRFCSNSCSAQWKWASGLIKEIKGANRFKKGHNVWNKGIEWFEMRGKNHPNYTGNTPKLIALRHSPKGVKWRKEVFQRDDYTCQYCKNKGGKLEAHHIVPVSIDKNKSFELSNGLTLCKNCHKKTDSYLNRWYIRKVKKLESFCLGSGVFSGGINVWKD